MAERTAYWVKPDGDKWRVQREGADKAAAVSDTKDEAIRRAVEMAKNQQPSQVLIQKQNGQIQEERTYGDDPPGTKG